ncbi:MAG: hypothetical protein GF414_08570 [Candidatus Altiarchaeales archaeon]|nr:hypothetical protein [Candidatus Altiarchaeales archaeon]
MREPCPACGSEDLPESADTIKNAFRDVVVRVCPRCGYLYNKKTCEAASGMRYPVYYGLGRIRSVRQGLRRIRYTPRHVDGGPLRIAEEAIR